MLPNSIGSNTFGIYSTYKMLQLFYNHKYVWRAFLPVGFLFLLISCGGNRMETRDNGPTGFSSGPGDLAARSSEPTFRKEGTVLFSTAGGDSILRINVEVAANDGEREQGLMYRTTIAANTGMLFLFEQPEAQSFWMKNTPSSLDILFISASGSILNIHKYTSPYSLEGLPSTGAADKVVEVAAGFCDKYKIKAGDKITYRLDSKPI